MIAFTLSFAGSPPSDGLPLRKVVQAKHLHLEEIKPLGEVKASKSFALSKCLLKAQALRVFAHINYKQNPT